MINKYRGRQQWDGKIVVAPGNDIEVLDRGLLGLICGLGVSVSCLKFRFSSDIVLTRSSGRR